MALTIQTLNGVKVVTTDNNSAAATLQEAAGDMINFNFAALASGTIGKGLKTVGTGFNDYGNSHVNLGGQTATGGTARSSSAGALISVRVQNSASCRVAGIGGSIHGNIDGSSSYAKAGTAGVVYANITNGARVQVNSTAGMCLGSADGTGATLQSLIETQGSAGNLSLGQVTNGAQISNAGAGCIVGGLANSDHSRIKNDFSDFGNIVHGYVTGEGSKLLGDGGDGMRIGGHVLGSGLTQGTSHGVHIFGYNNGGTMQATAPGARVGGRVEPGETASASASGAYQWGPGTNPVVDSFQVGSGIRLERNGGLYAGNIPTSDPGVAGYLWASGNYIVKSTG